MGSSNICRRKARGLDYGVLSHTMRRQIITRRRQLSDRQEGWELMNAFAWEIGEVYVGGYAWVTVTRQ